MQYLLMVSILCAFLVVANSCRRNSTPTTTDKSQTIESKATIQEKWPRTVKEAVDTILASMSQKDKNTVRNTKREKLILFHHGWGTGIRNDFGLWAGNKELMKDTKAVHPDEASMVIIEAVWEELQKKK